MGGGSLAIHEMAGGRKKRNLPAFLTVQGVLKTLERTKMLLVYRYTAVHTAALLY